MISENLSYINAAISSLQLQFIVTHKRTEKWRAADRAESYKRGIVWRQRRRLNDVIGHTRWMERDSVQS